jgi:hypothetical protein
MQMQAAVQGLILPQLRAAFASRTLHARMHTASSWLLLESQEALLLWRAAA